MKTSLFLLFSFVAMHCSAQNVSLDWVKTFGSTNYESSKNMVSDASGNLFIVGAFNGTTDFDPGPGVSNKTSLGGNDLFIQKLDSNGNFLWVQVFGNASNDIIEHAKVDHLGNIIVTGRFVDSIDFDPSVATDYKTANGLSDAYVLKLDGAGNYLWSKTFGNANHVTSRGLAINSSNAITISGRFINTVDFDPGPAVANKSALGVDIYILQLSSTGNFNWIKTLEGPANNSVQVNDIIYDDNDNLLVNGSFSDSLDVDPGPTVQYLVDMADPLQYALFILKLDHAGNYVWAKHYNNIVGNSVGISKLAFDADGNYYLGGTFFGSVDFDFGPGIYNLYAPAYCAYIMKLDSNANFIWARHMGGFSGVGAHLDIVWDLALDAQNNITLCGGFKGYEDFDPGPGIYYLGSPGVTQKTFGFLMQLDNTGVLNWAKSIGTPPAEAGCNSMTRNINGSLYFTGGFNGTTDFDFNAGSQYITEQGNSDVYLFKLKSCLPTSSNSVINSCKPIVWIDGNTYASNNFTAKDTLSGADGCDSIITLNLTISPLDTSIVKTGNTLNSNATGVTYQWVDCENNFTPLIGETNPSFTPSSNGSYALVLNNGSCTDTSSCYSFTVLGLDDFSANGISIFPNPTKGQVHIQTNGQALTLRIHNALGQIVYAQKIKNNQKVNLIDLSKVSGGLYTFTFWSKSQVVARGKLLLE